MVNMKELFANDRIQDQVCELVPLTEKETGVYLLEAGDLLFARQSLTFEGAGRCVLVLPSKGPRTWESHIMRVKLDPEKADPAFYYYFFRSVAGRRLMESIIQQVAAAGIRGSDLSRLKVPAPSVPQQRAISEVLEAIDEKISSNVRMAATVDSLIETHYKIATRESATTSPLFSAVTIDFGEPFKGANFSDEHVGRPLIRIRDLKTFKPQTWTTEIRPREAIVMPGDILIGMDAEFRATAWLGKPGLLNQRVCRARSTQFGAAYLREALRAPLAARENEKSATTVIHLNKGDLERTEITIAASDRLIAFEKVADPLFAQRIAIAEQCRTLAELRDTLLPELMSGRLRVKDAEKKIEEVV